MEWLPIARGLATHLVGPFRRGAGAKGGSNSARYCHTVFLRHLDAARQTGMTQFPVSIAELGPGLSLGTGIVGTLLGANSYLALDVSRDAAPERNLEVLTGVAELLRTSAIPASDEEFPEVLPHLGTRNLEPAATPSDLEDRVSQVAEALHGRPGSIRIEYRVPWADRAVIAPDSIDLLFSQAVLEHVTALDDVYRAAALWLRPGGYLTSSVDFRSHGLTRGWNGHWGYPDAVWRAVKGRRSWEINRAWWEKHAMSLRSAGLELLSLQRSPLVSALSREDLAPEFRAMSDEDLNTYGAFFVARKPLA